MANPSGAFSGAGAASGDHPEARNGERPQSFPRISSPVSFVAFLGFPLFSTSQAKPIFAAGVLIPAKKEPLHYLPFECRT